MHLTIFSQSKPARLALAMGVTGALWATGSSYGQTVTVDPTGTANGSTVFTNLQTAVASFATGGTNSGNAAPNVVNVRADHGPITGNLVALHPNSNPVPPAGSTLTIDGDLTIKGVDANGADARAVFAGTGLTNAQQNIRNNGFPRLAWAQAVNLTIKNLAFIPPTTGVGTVAESFIAVKAPAVAGVNPTVNIEDCVFTSNNGQNQPITTTGRPEDDANLSNAGVVSLPKGSACIWAFSRAERGDLLVNITRSVFASFTQLFTGDTGVRAEALKGWVSGSGPGLITFRINVNEGCVFANIDGNVGQIAWGGSIFMNGTASTPIVIRNLKRASSPAAVWLNYAADADDQPVAGVFNHVHFYDLVGPAISEGGVRAFLNSVTNCVFANISNDAIVLRAGTNFDSTGIGAPQITVGTSIFHNVGIGTFPSGIYGTAASARNVNITNSYFTDIDSTEYALTNNGTGVWTVADSTLSLSGASALAGTTGTGAGTVTLEPSVSNAEVTYVNTTDPFSADFFNVVGSAVNDWAIY